MILSQTELVQINHPQNMIGIACVLDEMLRGKPPKTEGKHIVQV